MAVELSEVETFDSVMDLGCATGRFYRFFREIFPGAHYRGIDISQVAIDYAKKLYLKSDFSLFDGDPSTIEGPKPDLLFCRDVLHHQPNPEEFLAKLYATAGKYLILRIRTREVGATVFDREQSCQYSYDNWVPFIVFNTTELTDLLSSYNPSPARIDIVRHPVVLGGQLGRYLPKEMYFPETGTSETSILIEKGNNDQTVVPKITSQTRPELRGQEMSFLFRLGKRLAGR
jgi:SAM-dependent methyltransferase